MFNRISILIIILFLSSCSDDHSIIIDNSDGQELSWIGCSNCPIYEDVWYVGESVPPFQSEIDGGSWDSEYQCDEIVLFQSEGYYNYILSSTPGIVRTKLLNDYYWVWEKL